MHHLAFEQFILSVNKNNTSAITVYFHYGFIISDDIIIDIGNGFVMNGSLVTMTIK